MRHSEQKELPLRRKNRRRDCLRNGGTEDVGLKPWQAPCLDDSLITVAFTQTVGFQITKPFGVNQLLFHRVSQNRQFVCVKRLVEKLDSKWLIKSFQEPSHDHSYTASLPASLVANQSNYPMTTRSTLGQKFRNGQTDIGQTDRTQERGSSAGDLSERERMESRT